MIHSYLDLDSKKSLRICVILAKHLFFEKKKIQFKYNSQRNQLRLADSFKASKQLTLQAHAWWRQKICLVMSDLCLARGWAIAEPWLII